MPHNLDRRRLVRAASGVLLAGGLVPLGAAGAEEEGGNDCTEVTAPEDLMREHGVLNRMLLIYEAVLDRLGRGEGFDVTVLARAANVVREFVENYHERNEEQHLFPRFRQAGKMVALVDVLYQQHQAGRRLTDNILGLVRTGSVAADDRPMLVGNLRAFSRMYRPHEAREDTVLFPQLRNVVSAHEFAAMAEDFEKDEHRKFGGDGFEMMVARVADLEKAIGINDLARFTPS
ncbi:MAG: hemerythrin domain-containing protein [Hyphomicrobiales bacterium]|nr:hemerythrin domain-containing protein [Hyphomicrobiales bacterium]MBV9427173.1 hemerythrin domain-containing protein [Bradyrhizobiaceae bacterium]